MSLSFQNLRKLIYECTHKEMLSCCRTVCIQDLIAINTSDKADSALFMKDMQTQMLGLCPLAKSVFLISDFSKISGDFYIFALLISVYLINSENIPNLYLQCQNTKNFIKGLHKRSNREVSFRFWVSV